MDIVIDIPVDSFLGQAAKCISDALNSRQIELDEDTTVDVAYMLHRVLNDEAEQAAHGSPANTTYMKETPIVAWCGDEGDTDGKLSWALKVFELELSERTDDLETILDDGRRTRIAETYVTFCKLLQER